MRLTDGQSSQHGPSQDLAKPGPAAAHAQDLQRTVAHDTASPSSAEGSERRVSRVELALTWASDLRLRLQLLLSIAGAAFNLSAGVDTSRYKHTCTCQTSAGRAEWT